jgi:hypothetical protein
VPTSAPVSQAAASEQPPQRKTFACIMLLISVVAMAGILLWAAFNKGPVPPKGWVALNHGQLEAQVQESIYGKPTALLFVAGEPTTKSAGEFARLLPGVEWRSAAEIDILGESFPVIWAAADPQVWGTLGLSNIIEVMESGEDGVLHYRVLAGTLSEEDLTAVRGQQATAMILLDTDLLVKVNAEFLTGDREQR